jgi:glucose/arabinose dehydrogenase
MRHAAAIPFTLALLTLFPHRADAQQVDEQVVGHIVRPERVEATDERIASLRLPEGFRIEKFAQGLGKPRMVAVAGDGAVFVTRRDPGDVLRLADTDGDGKADEQRTVASLADVHGIHIAGSRVYLATVREVYTADLREDGSLSQPEPIITDLPDGGQHPNRTLAVGPDGMLYITVGSTCNACDETNKESATIVRAQLDGSERVIYARGLRNTIGFDWRPDSGELWGFDHGIDWLGDDEQVEELNKITHGAHYGWPYVYGDGKFNPADDPPDMTKEAFAAQSTAPALGYTAHAAPMGMLFYTADQFPEEYRADALVAMHGSWNRKPPSGYEIVRVRFEGSDPAAIEPFLTGFLADDGSSHFGRPVGLALAADGSLLVTDDSNGVVYRIWHEGP